MLCPGIWSPSSNMLPLPPISPLITRCRALAALDLILSPDRENRLYFFDSHWSHSEQMASMRNGVGEEWWMVFHKDGWAVLKGLDHNCPAWTIHREKLSLALQRSLPAEFAEVAMEPVFHWNETSFAYFHVVGARRWLRANDFTIFKKEEAGDTGLLAHLIGEPADYADFASQYYESEVKEHLVAQIFAHRPITAEIVAALNPSTTLDEIAKELYHQIGYPHMQVA